MQNMNSQMRKSRNYADLQSELSKIRSALAHETMVSYLSITEPELFPDPIDQAAAEYEIEVAWSVKMLSVEKLRRIERALTSLHANSYGICSRCGQEIPPARLKVQPDSLYCVPCLTVIEAGVAGN